MKGDFTGIRRWPAKHYSSVRTQQGRVQLDTDWSDQVEIQNHLDRTEVIDVVGQAGGPKGANGGFRITAQPDGKDLLVAPGRFWVDGLLCELESNTSYLSQPDLPAPPFAAGGALSLANGTYVAYLDVWERHVTALEDGDLREPALRGPDTTTRTKITWQVKLLPVADQGSTGNCSTAFPEWTKLIAPPTGQLSARATVNAAADQCSVESTGGFRSLENQLYRVEIHAAGQRSGPATFKWSRENGSVVAAWTKLTGDVLGVATPGRDSVLGFSPGDWVELTDDSREDAQAVGVIVKLQKVDGLNLTIDPATFDPPGAVNYADFPRNPKVRRWEGDLPAAASAARPLLPNPVADGWIDLEDGVQVKFEDGDYRTGDYWVIPARVVLGDVIWPRSPANVPVPAAPLGVEHHYARLALLRKSAGGLEVTSCYPQFPPLTAITASDVSFDNTTCSFNPVATTVQQALDDLCKRSGGGCTLVVNEGTDLQAFFDQVTKQNQGSIAVCLTTGTWTLAKPVVINFAGDILLTGGGPGTRIIAPKSETALSFAGCKSVTVRDLFAETDVAKRGGPPLTEAPAGSPKHLNGTLDFVGCAAVTVEGVQLRCGSGVERAAACINVHHNPLVMGSATSAVRIRGCDLAVGNRQVGILLLDTSRAQVEDNTISVIPRPVFLGVQRLLKQNKAYRSILRKRMLSGMEVVTDTPDARVKAAQDAAPNSLVFALGGHLVKLQPEAAILPALRETLPSVSKTLGAPAELVDIHGIAGKLREKPAQAAARAPETKEAPGAVRPVRVPVDPVVLQGARDFAAQGMSSGTILAALRKVVTKQAVHTRLNQIANQILLSGGGAELKEWIKIIILGSPAAASQGIVVGGTQATEIHIRNNSISGVLQGIHAGLSHSGPKVVTDGKAPLTRRGVAPDLGGNIWIQSNTVQALWPRDASGERHGIFVGNFASAMIESNNLTLQRSFLAKDVVQGIKVFGWFGPSVQVLGNTLTAFTQGIWVHPLNSTSSDQALWLVARNLCVNCQSTVVQELRVRYDLNVP
jgi:hypothetical protein